MYALVVFILTFITSIAHMIDQQVDTVSAKVAGGSQVFVRSSDASPISLSALMQTPGVSMAVATRAGRSRLPRARQHRRRALAADRRSTRRLIQIDPPALDDRGSYSTDLEAWSAVLSDPGLIIADPMFLQGGGGPPKFEVKVGMPIRITDPISGRTRRVTVAAIGTSDYFINNGMLYGWRGAHSLFGDRLVASRDYLSLVPGTDPEAVRRAPAEPVHQQRH